MDVYKVEHTTSIPLLYMLCLMWYGKKDFSFCLATVNVQFLLRTKPGEPIELRGITALIACKVWSMPVFRCYSRLDRIQSIAWGHCNHPERLMCFHGTARFWADKRYQACKNMMSHLSHIFCSPYRYLRLQQRGGLCREIHTWQILPWSEAWFHVALTSTKNNHISTIKVIKSLKPTENNYIKLHFSIILALYFYYSPEVNSLQFL